MRSCSTKFASINPGFFNQMKNSVLPKKLSSIFAQNSVFWRKNSVTRSQNKHFLLKTQFFQEHRSPCPLILKIWCLLGNSHCLLLLVLWLITLWRVWNPRGSEAREILQKGHFYFLLSLTHSFSTKLCILVSKAWTTVPFVFVLSTVLCVPTFMYVKSYCMHKMHSLIY